MVDDLQDVIIRTNMTCTEHRGITRPGSESMRHGPICRLRVAHQRSIRGSIVGGRRRARRSGRAVVREAVSNAVRHAKATLTVRVKVVDDLCIEVTKSNGRGLPTEFWKRQRTCGSRQSRPAAGEFTLAAYRARAEQCCDGRLDLSPVALPATQRPGTVRAVARRWQQVGIDRYPTHWSIWG